MHITPHRRKRKILLTARLVTVDEGKDWKDENLIDVTGPEKIFFEASDKVPRQSLTRAVTAAMAELKRMDKMASEPAAVPAPAAPVVPPKKD